MSTFSKQATVFTIVLLNDIIDSVFNKDKPSTLNFRCRIQVSLYLLQIHYQVW